MKVTATTLPTPEATRGVGTSLYDSYISSVTSVNLKKADMASRNNVMFKKQYTLFWISSAVVFGLLVLGTNFRRNDSWERLCRDWSMVFKATFNQS